MSLSLFLSFAEWIIRLVGLNLYYTRKEPVCFQNIEEFIVVCFFVYDHLLHVVININVCNLVSVSKKDKKKGRKIYLHA